VLILHDRPGADFTPVAASTNVSGDVGVETVADPRATNSHVESIPEECAASTIPEALIHYSVGVEDVDGSIAERQAGIAWVVARTDVLRMFPSASPNASEKSIPTNRKASDAIRRSPATHAVSEH